MTDPRPYRLEPPRWAKDIDRKVSALGDVVKLREHCAVLTAAVKKLMNERSKLRELLAAERKHSQELETVIIAHMKKGAQS